MYLAATVAVAVLAQAGDDGCGIVKVRVECDSTVGTGELKPRVCRSESGLPEADGEQRIRS
jgi:hypothetical protein